jgi:hypothetical protein
MGTLTAGLKEEALFCQQQNGKNYSALHIENGPYFCSRYFPLWQLKI